MKISDNPAKKFLGKIFWGTIVLLLLGVAVKQLAAFIRWEADVLRAQQTPAYVQEGNMYVVPEGTSGKPCIEVPTGITFYRAGNDAELVSNGRKIGERIMTLEPGEAVQIRHVHFGGWEKRNRYSYNAAGDAYPICGPNCGPDKEKGARVRQQFRHDLPFGMFDPAVVVFYLCDPAHCFGDDKLMLAFDHIREEGGIMYLRNTSGKKVFLETTFNYMLAFLKDPNTAAQVGCDGSTATFFMTKIPASQVPPHTPEPFDDL